jgi:hypothetical protein
MGKVVSGTGSKLSKVDFGLKSEVSFPKEELMDSQATGSEVAYPLIRLEDEFKEAEIDYSRATTLPTLQAERVSLLSEIFKQNDALHILRGRITRKVQGGFIIRILGHDLFCPQSLMLGVPTPYIGRYHNFVLVNLNGRVVTDLAVTPGMASAAGSAAKIAVSGLVSAYATNIIALCNLIGDDEAWEASGGGSPKDRVAYLRMLTTMLMKKNPYVRWNYNVPTASTRKGKEVIDSDADPKQVSPKPKFQ